MENELELANILVTGTPGVGKTSLAMLLTDSLNEDIQTEHKYKYLSIGQLIQDKKLYTDWNKEFDVPEFDEDMILNELEPMLKHGGMVVDFHSSDFLPEEYFRVVVLLRCDNTILYDRLAARGYNEKKIKENIECEIMEVTSEEVRDAFPEEKILELQNQVIGDMEENITKIKEFLKNN